MSSKNAVDCPFCADNTDITVAEAAHCRVIYNRAPLVDGHCMVIPRRHVRLLLDLHDDEIAEIFTFARNITRSILRAYDCTGYDWIVQDGTVAGQTVPHMHLHIIPRKAGDLEEVSPWYEHFTGKKHGVDSKHRPWLSRQDQQRAAEHIRAFLPETIGELGKP